MLFKKPVFLLLLPWLWSCRTWRQVGDSFAVQLLHSTPHLFSAWTVLEKGSFLSSPLSTCGSSICPCMSHAVMLKHTGAICWWGTLPDSRSSFKMLFKWILVGKVGEDRETEANFSHVQFFNTSAMTFLFLLSAWILSKNVPNLNITVNTITQQRLHCYVFCLRTGQHFFNFIHHF